MVMVGHGWWVCFRGEVGGRGQGGLRTGVPVLSKKVVGMAREEEGVGRGRWERRLGKEGC